ncbi:MAG TPA: hypothetical protein VF416_07585, partial [Marmoricola sp.]
MTNYTISGTGTLPDDTTPLPGAWYISLASGYALDDGSGFRASRLKVLSSLSDGSASVTLPETVDDDYYLAYFVANDRSVRLPASGTYAFELSADMTWDDIIDTPTVPPMTPSLVSRAESAATTAETARDDAQAAQTAAEAAETGAEASATAADGSADAAAASATAAADDAATVAADAAKLLLVGTEDSTLVRIDAADGTSTWLQASAADGGPTDYAAGMIGSALDLPADGVLAVNDSRIPQTTDTVSGELVRIDAADGTATWLQASAADGGPTEWAMSQILAKLADAGSSYGQNLAGLGLDHDTADIGALINTQFALFRHLIVPYDADPWPSLTTIT